MSDERFRALATDPRYRLPSRGQAQTAVDSRFKRLFTDDNFQRKAKVDRYGRKVKRDSGKAKFSDRFRLEDEDTGEAAKIKTQVPAGESSEEEVTDDEQIAASKGRDHAREGFSGSSSEEESSSEEDSEEELDLAEETAGNEQSEQVPMGEVTKRIAVVNLDWDHIRATDIMAVAQSFVPTGGSIVSATIYPSEFGLERMAQEELEGPPRAIFASTHRRENIDSSDSDDADADDERIRKKLLAEQAIEGKEFDTAKLRQYQLDRLRYYYAVIECDEDATAKALYDDMDGREYLTTANFFDLRFIPAETTFDADPRDECRKLPEGYKPHDFRTDALTHSKVKLTWDEDDTTRKAVQKRAFSRAEMDEDDLRAYIGSESSDADSVTSRISSAVDRKAKEKEAAKSKMRALLGLPQTAEKRSSSARDEPVGDMQITFTAGLSAKGGNGLFDNQTQDEINVRDQYIQKERERRLQRKEKAKASKSVGEEVQAFVDEDDPFNDPFFENPATATKLEAKAKQVDRQKKRDAKKPADDAAAGRRAELELLMAGDEAEVQHFDMKEIEKAQKDSRKKKSKKQKGNAEDTAAVDEFKLQTADPRFSQLFESHDFAIDPTNPRFKGTQGMKDLLEEGRKKRRAQDDPLGESGQMQKKSKKQSHTQPVSKPSQDVSGLVARLKSRTKP